MKKIIPVVLAAFGLLICSFSFAAKMNEKEFTEYFMSRLTAEIKDKKFQIVRPLQIKSKDTDGYEHTQFLDNAYTQYSASPDFLSSIIDSHINGLKAQKDVFSQKSGTTIVALLKSADYLETAKKQLLKAGFPADAELPLLYEKLNDDIYILFAFDMPNGMRMMTKKDLTENKIDPLSLRMIAQKNLDKYFEANHLQIKRLGNTGSARIYSITLDQSYEASILLLTKYWEKKYFDVEGDPVVFVPARNVVVITGSKDQEGIRIASYLAKKGYAELGYAISPKGYIYENGKWKIY